VLKSTYFGGHRRCPATGGDGAGLGRESLYKALTPGAKPRYDTMLKLLHALGVKLSASPVHL